MTISRKAWRTALLTGMIVAGAYLATASLLNATRLHFNDSRSVPIGLYRETSGETGSYAAICLSSTVLKSARQAGLRLDPGDCPGGVEPILKPLVRASRERSIRFTERGFQIAGTFLPNTSPKPLSSTGRSLSHYPFGTYAAGLWAISDYNPDSFDSRYFGPVDPTAIRFYATPLFTH